MNGAISRISVTLEHLPVPERIITVFTRFRNMGHATFIRSHSFVGGATGSRNYAEDPRCEKKRMKLK